MKFKDKLSIFSGSIALFICLLKLLFDLQMNQSVKSMMSEPEGDFSITLVAGTSQVILTYILPIVISLTLSIIGFVKHNRFRKLSLGLNIFATIYLFIPVGLILATLQS